MTSARTPAATSAPTPLADRDLASRLVREQFAVIETGDLDLAGENVTPDFVNHRSVHEPLPARDRGPDALRATANGCAARSATSASRSTTSRSSATARWHG